MRNVFGDVVRDSGRLRACYAFFRAPPSMGSGSSQPRQAFSASDGVIGHVVWLRGAYRMLGISGAVKKTLNAFKKELETLESFKSNGYTLRTRYPSDARSRGKQRWQKSLWVDFFQNQGFHRDDSDPLGNDEDIFIYRYEPR